MKNDKLSEIERLVQSGQTEGVEQLVDRLMRSKKLNPLERVRVSRILIGIEKTQKALRVLGKSLGIDELNVTTDDEIHAQIRLARVLDYIGAKYVASKIRSRLDEVFESKKVNIERFFSDFILTKAVAYLGGREFSKALSEYEKVVKVMPDKSFEQFLGLICKADCLEGMGRAKEAIDLVEEIVSKGEFPGPLFEGIAKQALCEYYFRQDNFDAAIKWGEMSLKIFDELKDTKDKAYLYQELGAAYLGKKDLAKSKELLLRAKEIIFATKTQPLVQLAIIYWLEQHPETFTSLGESVSLRAHPNFSQYSFLVGKRFQSRDDQPLNPWHEKRKVQSEYNCWIVEAGEIKPVKYDHVIKNYLERGEVFIDLFSGFRFEKNGKINLLGELITRFLQVVIGSGEVGINEWSLVDFIYRQDFYDPKSGQDRVKNLFKNIKDKKFHVKKEEKFYSYDFSKDIPLILPMHNSEYSEFNLLKSHGDSFDRQSVEKIYRVNKAKAVRLLNEWEEQGLVKSSGAGKNVKYQVL